MSNLFRRAIYIGKPRTKDWSKTPGAYPVYIPGSGWFTQSFINFGMTGYAVSIRKGQWDFRPDGLNVSHIVRRDELQLFELTDAPMELY
jgi:hypothetical protein